MIRRPRRVWPAVLAALVIFALCLVAAISLIQKLTGGNQLVSYDSVATRLHGIYWTDPVVLTAGIVALVLGLFLLGLAVLPGRPVLLPLGEIAGSTAGVARRSVRSALAREVNALPGIDAGRIALSRKKIRLKATSVHPMDIAPPMAGPANPGGSATAADPISTDGAADPERSSTPNAPDAESAVRNSISRTLSRIGVAEPAVRTRIHEARKEAGTR
ncbi:DUF6286 domain-containing protein [Nocardia sp. NBC_00511]|uniref:DUF6286 domain-containing protein n=1 Tax=Nocardia sp. NBC_00511 TaxID=2903591 RepID=UPI0030E52872